MEQTNRLFFIASIADKLGPEPVKVHQDLENKPTVLDTQQQGHVFHYINYSLPVFLHYKKRAPYDHLAY